MNQFKELLRADGSVIYNKKLAHAIGINETIIYSDLISKEAYFSEKNQLVDGWFFNTSENIWKDTALTARQQKAAIDHLEKLKLVETKVFGMPARKYFKISSDYAILIDLLSQGQQNQQLRQNVETRTNKMSKQASTKCRSNNNKHDNNNKNNNYIGLRPVACPVFPNNYLTEDKIDYYCIERFQKALRKSKNIHSFDCLDYMDDEDLFSFLDDNIENHDQCNLDYIESIQGRAKAY